MQCAPNQHGTLLPMRFHIGLHEVAADAKRILLEPGYARWLFSSAYGRLEALIRSCANVDRCTTMRVCPLIEAKERYVDQYSMYFTWHSSIRLGLTKVVVRPRRSVTEKIELTNALHSDVLTVNEALETIPRAMHVKCNPASREGLPSVAWRPLCR